MIVRIRLPKQSEKVKVLEFYVTESENGVTLKTVEDDFNILTITHDGMLIKHGFIDDKLGLVLNDRGQIIEEPDR